MESEKGYERGIGVSLGIAARPETRIVPAAETFRGRTGCNAQPISFPVQPATQNRRCPACGTENYDQPPVSHSCRPWRLKACRECDFVYLENVIGYNSLREDFAWERTYQAEREIRRRRSRLRYLVSDGLKKLKLALRRNLPREIRLIRRYIPGGRLLDVGCASGGTFRCLAGPYTPFGIEVSQRLADEAEKVCRSRSGQVIRDHAFRGLGRFTPGFFDGALMISYLEHEMRPQEVLEEVRRVLKPDGTLIVKVPNYACFNRRVMGARWCGYRFPDHVNYFTPASLRRMLLECGFVLRRFAFKDRSPLSDSMWAIAAKPCPA